MIEEGADKSNDDDGCEETVDSEDVGVLMCFVLMPKYGINLEQLFATRNSQFTFE